MKKKIIIALAIFSLVFMVSGLSIISMKEKSCAQLDNLVKLHQIEILRGHLLIHIKWVQSDLHLKDTQHARSMDTISEHVQVLSTIVNSCFECHHSKAVSRKLETLNYQIQEYQTALNRVFTVREDAAGLHREEETAFRIGEKLISEVDTLTTVTSRKLDVRTQNALNEITRTNRMLYVLLAVVPFVAIGLSAVFIRGITRPVNELLTATRRLKGGNLEYRISGLKDEYGEVGASFNDMAESLKQHLKRMQWSEQLIMLGELTGGLAHDMKNPLAGIKVTMKVLSDDPTLSAPNRQALLKAIDQIRRIEGLLRSLLNLSRPPKLKPVRLDVNEAVETALHVIQKHPTFSSRSADEPVVIEKDLPAHLPSVLADPFQLQQVCMNLIINAAEAMPRGGTLMVRTKYDEMTQSIVITIADSGPGIDEALLDKIFNPFFTTKQNGTGLGLAISRRLIGQHGGTIGAKNASDGGAVFTITMPVNARAEVMRP